MAYYVFTRDGETYLGKKLLTDQEAAKWRRNGYKLYPIGTV